MVENATTTLKALEAVDFEWAVHLKSVWSDIDYDIPSIHGEERDAILSRIHSLEQSPDPRSRLGLVIRGNAGAGKTHMLSALRRHVLSRDQIFILVDMTDVREFWETVNQGYLASLEQATPTGESQLTGVLRGLIRHSDAPFSLQQITDSSNPSWSTSLNQLLRGLARHDKSSTRSFADVIRAASLLASDDFQVSGIAYNWLLGIPLDEQDFRQLGFSRPCCTSMEAVEGLSWLIGLTHSTVLALDQLDSIVTQHSLVSSVENTDSDEQKLSQAIIESIGGGLSALRDKTCRTLTIVTCIEKTWDRLTSLALSSFTDRFEASPVFLANVYDPDSSSEMVANRLRAAYQMFGIDPPYRSWPYTAEFFRRAEGLLPRQLLKQCDRHRQICLEKGEITELTAVAQAPPPPPQPSQELDQLYEQLSATCTVPDLTNERQEDGDVAALIQFAVIGLALEQDMGGSIEHEADTQFTGGWRTCPLHARIRQIIHTQGGDERHLSLRVLLRSNSRAYGNRIKLAMGASGIGRGLKHRHLLVLRNTAPPAGRISQQLTHEFHAAGGEFVSISEHDLHRLVALRHLRERNPAEFELWQMQRRPVSQLAVFRSAVAWLRQHDGHPETSRETSGGFSEPASTQGRWLVDGLIKPPAPPPRQLPTEAPLGRSTFPESNWPVVPPPIPQPTPQQAPADDSQHDDAAAVMGRIPVGFRLIGQQEGPVVSIAVEELAKHTVVLAGAGSGKTVLIRRLVEEAALQGIPSIVIDGANDLGRLGDRWDHPPQGWRTGDRQKAEAYHDCSEVILWTPGLESGNPLQLNPLPKFADIDDGEELDQATDMARDALQDIVAPGGSPTASMKRGILKAALNHFAQLNYPENLEAFIDLLLELPPEICEGIPNADKKAKDMAGMLRAEVLNNPLLRQSGHSLDPATLLDTASDSNATRISVINLSGLQGLSAQRQFLNQLFMTLFTWIKKNPPPPEIPLRALLVLDEARDFVPSRESTACKSSFNRLVAQARKYGLGIVVATQAPKSIDHNVIANCSTQFFGRANSPTAIGVVSEAISQRGGHPGEVSRLTTGQFYVSSVELSTPVKIRTPNCLSYHPPSPLNEEEVIQRAGHGRLVLGA